MRMLGAAEMLQELWCEVFEEVPRLLNAKRHFAEGGCRRAASQKECGEADHQNNKEPCGWLRHERRAASVSGAIDGLDSEDVVTAELAGAQTAVSRKDPIHIGVAHRLEVRSRATISIVHQV